MLPTELHTCAGRINGKIEKLLYYCSKRLGQFDKICDHTEIVLTFYSDLSNKFAHTEGHSSLIFIRINTKVLENSVGLSVPAGRLAGEMRLQLNGFVKAGFNLYLLVNIKLRRLIFK